MPRPWVAAGLAALVLAAPARAAFPPAPQSPPALRTTIDVTDSAGLTEWASVLSNPRNVVWDSRAGGITCPNDDGDCTRGPRLQQDLRRFAWTADATNLYFYLERQLGVATDTTFFLFLDENANGRMQTGERVVRVEWLGSRTIRVQLVGYQESAGGGDPISLAGVHDGHALAGSIVRLTAPDAGAPPDCVQCATVDNRVAEFRVPWTALATAGGPRGVVVHVAAYDSPGAAASLNASTAKDNAGLTTVTSGVRVVPAASFTSVPPGTRVELAFDLEQLGNTWVGAASGERFNLEAHSETGLPLELWRDSTAGVLLGRDANGDGDFDDAEDTVNVDGDGNGRPDTGLAVPIGGSRTVVVAMDVPADAQGLVDRVELRARPETVRDTWESGESAVHAGPVVLFPNTESAAAPGAIAPHSLRVENHEGAPRRVDFDVALGTWAASLHLDDGSGGPGSVLTDSDADTLPDVLVPAGSGIDLVLAVTVAPGARSGVGRDTTVVRAIPDGRPDAVAVIEATTEAWDALALDRAHDAAFPLGVREVPAGERTWMPHRAVNGGDTDALVFLFATVLRGSASLPVFFSDPNGDGHPDDGELLDSAVGVSVPAHGGSFPFVVASTIGPQAVGADVQLEVQVFSDLGDLASVLDDTIVSEGLLSPTAAHEVPLLAAGPCQTVGALATGTRAGNSVFYVWTGPLGQARSQVHWSDELGTSRDQRDVLASDAVGTWLVDAGAISMRYTLEKLASLSAPKLTPSVDFSTLQVEWIVTSEHLASEIAGATLQTTVLTADATLGIGGVGSVLVSDGATAGLSAYDGVRTTHDRPVATLGPGERFADRFGLRGIDWSGGGAFRVHARLISPCGDVLATYAEDFDVDTSPPDRDGDTVPDDIDNCPDDPNTTQDDRDMDSVGNVCDNCADDPNTMQDDRDMDSVGDVCDNCADAPNPGQVDRDLDSVGDACDGCPDDPNPGQTDGDGDTVQDACDNCPTAPNGGQADRDMDDAGDVCDPCPDDPDDLCRAVDVLRNAEPTARDIAQVQAVLVVAEPALDPVADLWQAGVEALPEVRVAGDALVVGQGSPGVIVLYELAGEPANVLRVRKDGADIVLSGW